MEKRKHKKTVPLGILVMFLVSMVSCSHLSTANRADALNEYGVRLAQRNNWKEAEFYWNRALQIEPNHMKTLNNIAVLLERKGNFEEARQLYEKILDTHPGAAVVKRNLRSHDKMKEELAKPTDDKEHSNGKK